MNIKKIKELQAEAHGINIAEGTKDYPVEALAKVFKLWSEIDTQLPEFIKAVEYAREIIKDDLDIHGTGYMCSCLDEKTRQYCENVVWLEHYGKDK